MVTILKSEVSQARASLLGQVRFSERAAEPEWWDFEAVRDWLVDAAILWRRSPGTGRPPFATDGPWMQMTRDAAAGDYDARGTDGTSSDVKLGGGSLSVEEVGRRDRISDWLRFVPKPEDRRLLVMAVDYLAGGRRSVPWRQIKQRLGIRYGEGGLRKRYDRAIRSICEGLNGAESRK